MTKPLYSIFDKEREYTDSDWAPPWRTCFSRDYGRVIHSPSFRRLQGKTQVFPGHESDFFRNRLTHSLEVAQIAEGIADRLNATDPNLLKHQHAIDPRLCATASLMHDVGHPPFGHNGERALDKAMREHGGFEGNAQTLRIVSRLEKKMKSVDGDPLGLGLCFRTLAAVLKYDKAIPRSRREGSKLVKGYYESEKNLVQKIKSSVVPDGLSTKQSFKTVECYIMDVADDIAYSTFDLEDSLKAGFLTPSEILSSSPRLLSEASTKVAKELGCSFNETRVLEIFADIFAPDSSFIEEDDTHLTDFRKRYHAYRAIANDAHLRTALSSELVKKAINSVELVYNEHLPMLSEVKLSQEARKRVEVLKQYTYVATIYSPRVKLPEYRGDAVVGRVFEALSGERGFLLMPDDVRELHQAAEGDRYAQMRVVCDFVAGMTDRYAMEFYGRLHSDTAQSMFKPL